MSIFTVQLIDVDAAINLEEAQSLLGTSSKQSSVRCVDSRHVLKGLATVFAANSKPATEPEAEALYGLSQETDTVDHFISHSWSAGRLKKWAALTDYYYRTTAVLAANFAALALAALACLLRIYLNYMDGPMHFFDAFVIWTLLPAGVAVASVTFGHVVLPQLSSRVFLDRLCIHQWDDDLKQLGVRSLGDVLLKSKKMIVLWSEDYMERLWCIFEIATFSANKEATDMVFIPLWMTPFLYTVLIGAMLMLFLASLLQEVSVIAPLFYPLLDVFQVTHGRNFAIRFVLGHCIPSVPLCYFIRRAVYQKTAMLNWVAQFRLDHTKLTVENDRAFIYDHINKLFGSTEQFERFVRNDMLRALHQVIGQAWEVPYSWGLFAFQPYLWYVTTDAMSTPAEVIEGYGWYSWQEYFFLNLLWYLPFYFMMPWVLKAVARSSSFTMNWPCGIGLFIDVCVFVQLVVALAMICWEPVLQSPLLKHIAQN